MRHRRTGRACAGSSIPRRRQSGGDARHPRAPRAGRRRNWLSADGRVGLGHRRLSIVDLSCVRASAHGVRRRTALAHAERRDLQPPRAAPAARGARSPLPIGLRCRGRLARLRGVGPGVLERLSGMFAFGLWDEPRAGALPRPRPLRHQAALLLRARRPAALRLRGEGPAGAPASPARSGLVGGLRLPRLPLCAEPEVHLEGTGEAAAGLLAAPRPRR